jgi:hypothetical protein
VPEPFLIVGAPLLIVVSGIVVQARRQPAKRGPEGQGKVK